LGLPYAAGLAFDSAGNLFVTDSGGIYGYGHIYKFTPGGVRTTFASGLAAPAGLPFAGAANLFAGARNDRLAPAATLYKCTPGGMRTTFASGMVAALAFQPTLPPAPTAAISDFNGDGHPDYVLYNRFTRQTAIWYLNNNVFIGGRYGLTIPAGWSVVDVADFD